MAEALAEATAAFSAEKNALQAELAELGGFRLDPASSTAAIAIGETVILLTLPLHRY